MTINDDHDNRTQRRREQKEHPEWNEEEWGKEEFREFDACQVCGCKNRYVVEAMRGQIPDDKMRITPPVLGSLQFNYDTALYRNTITAVVDVCCKCGALWTVARSHKKVLLSSVIMKPKGRG
jgi:hypothetical protein